jgi:hypothetical protein
MVWEAFMYVPRYFKNLSRVNGEIDALTRYIYTGRAVFSPRLLCMDRPLGTVLLTGSLTSGYRFLGRACSRTMTPVKSGFAGIGDIK